MSQAISRHMINKFVSQAISRRVINKFVSRAIRRHVINKSVSQAIGCHVMGKNHKFPREILKEKKLKCNILFFMHLFKMLLHYFDFLTPTVVILIIKNSNFLCSKSMANIE